MDAARLFLLFSHLLLDFRSTSGRLTIEVPSAGNCGDDTVLTCQVTGSIGSTGWDGLNRGALLTNGVPNRPEDNNKYKETRGTSSFNLTIHNTDITDEGDYTCRNDFDQSQKKRLNIQCKASSATHSITGGKKVQIIVDKLYPASPTLTATIKIQNDDMHISGSTTCSNSTQYTGYYRCVWTSNNSLDDGSYTYSIVVTTITQAAPLAGSFKIASPNTPLISNVVQLNATREVVYGNEGQSLTIQCTSTGGYPSPTVTWYKNSIYSSNQLSTTSSGTLQSDGTYTVNLQHTFTPATSDDMKYLICRSYYPQADSAQAGSNSKSVLLYLTLKPSQPTVTQTSVVPAGSTVTVRCTTSGCRPAASISWLYQGGTYGGSTTNTADAATETFTVVSIYTRQVTAADNGQSIQCIVTHPALVNPAQLTKSTNLNVQFGPSTTQITGNREIIATGSTPLTLTCTTGSSNPASDITWRNGSYILESNRQYTNSSGVNNGVVRSQQLILYLTRYMNGDDITCSVSNSVSQSPVVDKVKLNLKYSPHVTIQGQQQQYTLNEGENKQFTCTVDSNPISKITWYHGNSLISQETPTNGVSRLSFTPVNRKQYGSYSCKAKNEIGTEQQDQISITVKFKPLTTTITGNNNTIANGKTTLTLDCTSGSSNPISDITWTINNIITQATQDLSNQNGEYGGIKRRQRLILTPTRVNDGDIISCQSKNILGTSNSNEETLDLRYRPLIKPMSDVIVVEGNNIELICAASSKPASTFKWYKQGQSKVLHNGTGTLDNNKLSYRLTNVRRGDAATYTCNANNGIENADNKNVLLTVYYPPDVSATTTNTTINAAKAIVTCNAHGVPDNNYTYGKWVQTWPGYNTPISEHSGSQRLELTNLTYKHSGIYTCTASNGIKVFGTDQEYMEGSVQLVVKSFPIITNFSEITSSKLMENATIDVYYFSNAAGSNVKIYRNVNGSRQDVKYSVTETTTQVNLKVFKQTIKTAGVRARLLIHVQTKDDIGSYDVVVKNEINSTVRSFEIVAKGPPSLPFNLTIDNVNYNEARLSWRRGYHGGFPQTFVIQLSTDQKSWRDVKVFDGKNESDEMISKLISDLSPSTTYFVRMYSFNEEGNSTATGSLNYTTSSIIETEGPNIGAIIGGAAGGSAALVTILVFVLLMRRGTFAKCKTKDHDGKCDRKPVYEDEDDYGMRDNPMYVPAGPRDQSAGGSGQSGAEVEYSTVNKQKTPVIVNQNDVYAEVDKSKKMKANNGKKDKKEKKGLVKDKKGKKTALEGDLYENATELMDAKKGRTDEIIYENPEPAKQTAKKNVNKDGLIYADLTFNDQPKGQKKLVIHGLDDMTEYVQVDFTKKAEPLPDSDDENNTPK